MTKLGHNERSYRLDGLAAQAREGLERVEKGEEFTIGGWLAYGDALNEGRALFPADRQFGEWVQSANLAEWNGKPIHDHDRAAAMWAAANADQFEEARQRGNPRTIRGIHAKWKEIEAERAEEERRRKAEEKKAQAEPPRAPAPEQPQDQNETPEPASAAPSQHGEPGGSGEEGDRLSPAAPPDPEEQASGPGPDEHADLRAEFRRLSEEGREEDWIGLRVENEELRQRVTSQRSQIADLKAEVKELTSGDGAGRTIGNLQRRLAQSEGRSKEHQANAARLQRQVNAQKAEIGKLRKQIEGQEITL